MWLDRVQMLIAVVAALQGAAMVVIGAVFFSVAGLLTIISGLIILFSGIWFTRDALRRMQHRRVKQEECQPAHDRSAKPSR